jgi:hypothetical protein
MVDWINIILFWGKHLGIPYEDHHLFQIVAFVACDLLWFYRNNGHHEPLKML